MTTDERTWEERFRSSLPESYRRRHGAQVVARHAEICAARGQAAAHVGVVDAPDGQLGLCIAAADAPGLFSNIAAAIRLQGYDIAHAEAYTRKTAGGALEVLDLFRLQPQPGRSLQGATPLDVAASISEALRDLISGKLDPSRALPDAHPAAEGERDTRVRFIEDEEGALSTLEVETGDRSGLLLTLTRSLSVLRVTIVHSEVRTRRGRVYDRFTVAESNGTPISEARRLELQVHVLAAIEDPARQAGATTPNAPSAED